MRGLKFLVIFMGVLLVAGVVALVLAIAYRVGHRTVSAPIVAMSSAMSPNDRDRIVDLPAGAKILSDQTEGDRLTLRIALPNGEQELLLLDWKTGARLATFDLRLGPAENSRQ